MRVTPWLTDGAVSFIAQWIAEQQSKPVVWEFGSGFSTLWFLSLGAKVYSVEHDHGWSRKIETVAVAFGLAERLTMIRSDRPYHKSLSNREFDRPDLLLIDGRDRVLCLEANLPELNSGGILVVDNFERVRGRYAPMIELTRDLDAIHFEQPREVTLSGEAVTLQDRSLHRVRHRWLTSVFFQRSAALTTRGVRLLNSVEPEAG